MKCPHCAAEDSKVLDTRPVDENNSIKRRRECLVCHGRFTTYEIVDVLNPIVVKKEAAVNCSTRTSFFPDFLKPARRGTWTRKP